MRRNLELRCRVSGWRKRADVIFRVAAADVGRGDDGAEAVLNRDEEGGDGCPPVVSGGCAGVEGAASGTVENGGDAAEESATAGAVVNG